MQIDMTSQAVQQYSRVMDILLVQHKTIAQNISNTNTPGYIRKNVDFAGELDRVLNQTEQFENQGDSVSMAMTPETDGLRPTIEPFEDTTSPVREDGNNVNLEKEMVDIAQVSQLYGVMAKMASKKMKLAQYVISGGR